MGCGSCGSGGGCSTGGCGKSGGCATGGCNKLNTFDWLGNMLPPDATETDNVYEVRFKNTRKGFYRNVNGLRLNIGDWIVVEGDRGGFDIGQITLGGMLAQLQLHKKRLQRPEVLRLYRKASEADLKLLEEVRSKEKATTSRTREIIMDLRLDMKLSDVEFQGDNTKATFYYISDHRVDFRELIKLLAKEFKVRVEMRQIGLRHEAGLVGGIGVCGRELCCSTWLTEFKVVNTSAARYQNLSLNPTKISGLCGRLKCCLNFELDTYRDALKDFPDVDHFQTKKGKVVLQKTDIFRRKMWFSYLGESTWYALDTTEVKKFVELAKKGEPIDELTQPDKVAENEAKSVFDFVDVVGQSVDEPDRDRRNNRNKKRNNNNRDNKARDNKNPQPQKREGQQKEPQAQKPPQVKPQGPKPQNPQGQGVKPQNQPKPQNQGKPQQPKAPVPPVANGNKPNPNPNQGPNNTPPPQNQKQGFRRHNRPPRNNDGPKNDAPKA